MLIELLDLPRGKDEWFRELVRELAGRTTSQTARYPRPCCDFLTLTEPASGTHAICPVCWWEDDMVQFRDLDYAGGANKPRLRDARQTFRAIRVSEARFKSRARPPRPEEHPLTGRSRCCLIANSGPESQSAQTRDRILLRVALRLLAVSTRRWLRSRMAVNRDARI